jgi:hypothetical protein
MLHEPVCGVLPVLVSTGQLRLLPWWHGSAEDCEAIQAQLDYVRHHNWQLRRRLRWLHPSTTAGIRNNDVKQATRRANLFWGIFVALWIAIGGIWWSRRPVPVDQAANDALSAMMAADGVALKRMAFPDELEANPRLNANGLSRIYKELVVPRVNRLKRKANVDLVNNGDQGVASFEIESRHGFKLTMGAEAYSTENGPRVSVLRTLYGAWIMEYYDQRNVPFDLLNRNRAVLAGVQKDREVLKAAGVDALSDVNIMEGAVVMTPISEFIPRYEAWNKQLEKEAASKSSPAKPPADGPQ